MSRPLRIETHSELSQKSKMELFANIVTNLGNVYNFCKKTRSWMFDCVVNMSLMKRMNTPLIWPFSDQFKFGAFLKFHTSPCFRSILTRLFSLVEDKYIFSEISWSSAYNTKKTRFQNKNCIALLATVKYLNWKQILEDTVRFGKYFHKVNIFIKTLWNTKNLGRNVNQTLYNWNT